jgi:hypothetical protein
LVVSVALIAVWMRVLIDLQIARLVLIIVGGFGVALAMVRLPMGLGLLGFGRFTAGDRVVS